MSPLLRGLERRVLGAARRLSGSMRLRGVHGIPDSTWMAFEVACNRLHRYHSEMQKAKKVRRPLDSSAKSKS